MKRTDALTDESDRRLAVSVLEVGIGANRKVVEELLVRNDGLTVEETRWFQLTIRQK